jgi:transposase-like protein
VPPGLPADLDAVYKGLTDDAAALKTTAAAMQVFHDAMAALSLAGTGWVTVLDTIDGKVVAAIKYYLEAGVSQQALATAYGLTATQIAAVDAARTNELAGMELEETFKKRRIELAALELKATNEQVIANLKKNNANEEFLQKEIAAATQSEAWWNKATESTDKTTAATDKATAATGVYMNQLHSLVNDPKIAAFFGGNAVANTLYSGGQGGFTPQEAAAMGAGQFINMAGVGQPGLGMHRRAAGGPVSAGQPYLVGEKGPELFVPGQSGTVAANGAGVTVNNVFHIVDTEANIARRVSDQITRTVLQGRQMAS